MRRRPISTRCITSISASCTEMAAGAGRGHSTRSSSTRRSIYFSAPAAWPNWRKSSACSRRWSRRGGPRTCSIPRWHGSWSAISTIARCRMNRSCISSGPGGRCSAAWSRRCRSRYRRRASITRYRPATPGLLAARAAVRDRPAGDHHRARHLHQRAAHRDPAGGLDRRHGRQGLFDRTIRAATCATSGSTAFESYARTCYEACAEIITLHEANQPAQIAPRAPRRRACASSPTASTIRR